MLSACSMDIKVSLCFLVMPGKKDRSDGNTSSRVVLKDTTYKDGITPEYMYPMYHDPRGKAFIINNRDFLPASGMEKYPRKGTDVDAESLYSLFCALKFETVVYKNQTSKQIINIFDYYATMDHSNEDCIICAILTHGEEGLIYSTDGKLMLKELTTKFRSKSLRGIPKLFFFQACQGESLNFVLFVVYKNILNMMVQCR